MTFHLLVKIILMIAALFSAIAAMGATEDKMGDRCVVLATMFTTAVVVMLMFEKVYGV